MSVSTRRIAMWSGPRNISTALMRSWENRPDTWVCDEPFYAHYLVQTGADHPGRDVVIAKQENDWQKVVSKLLGPVPNDLPIYYQKHMTHHFLSFMAGDWLQELDHVFLVREPGAMLQSLSKILDRPVLRDTGLEQQLSLFRLLRERTGRAPLVMNSETILRNPEAALRRLCDCLAVPFRDEMLSWPPGPRDTDGVWAPWWYDSVIASTGFRPYVESSEPLPDSLEELYQECLEYYRELAAHSLELTPSSSR